jgi:hypothetical protein
MVATLELLSVSHFAPSAVGYFCLACCARSVELILCLHSMGACLLGSGAFGDGMGLSVTWMFEYSLEMES